MINSLSDHDAQVLSLFNNITPDVTNEFYFYRKINKHSLNEFQTTLSYESWEDVFSNTNTIFNNFLNTSLRNFYTRFP
jgi:hypothetical protein